LLAVFFFAVGRNLLALFFCCAHGAVDYVDGEVARRTTGATEKGRWIDGSLDWLLYLLLLGGIAYGIHQPVLGCVCIIATVFANYVDSTKRTIRLDRFPFSPIIFICVGAMGQMVICYYLITFFAVLRASILWVNSVR
jgi:phosphatidylglycerophosphate synthase